MIRPCSLVSAIWLAALSGSASGDDLMVRVEAHKSVVAVGEPVLITATVTNGGSEPVKLIHHNAPTLAHVPFCVVAPRFGAEKERLDEWSDELRLRKKMEPKLLAPGESITVELVMLFNRKHGFFATQPGKYWIGGRVATRGNAVEIFAPPVEIEIREPAPSDKAAWDWLNAHKEEYGRLVQVPWEAKLSDEFLKECEDTCEKAPTAYSEYLAYFLSRWYQEGPGKTKENAKEKSARFAEIAKSRATSDKIRAEADKLLSAREAPRSP